MKWKPDGFLMGMFAAIVLALVFPGPGAKGGFLHPELLTKGGVALIFSSTAWRSRWKNSAPACSTGGFIW